MKNGLKWLLALIGGYSAFKAISLLAMPVDGDGIGIYVGFLEINDRLPNDKIPMVSGIFASVGLFSLLTAVALHCVTAKER